MFSPVNYKGSQFGISHSRLQRLTVIYSQDTFELLV
uniref:Uncharacterized protein n=1 Tax=Anguilla anguilla TaxID=7936 RepID=A0A0E9TUZ8_ANGAN